MYFGGFKRESIYSNASSNQNRRYDSPKMDGFEELKTGPFTVKNASTSNKNIFQLMQDEINNTERNQTDVMS